MNLYRAPVLYSHAHTHIRWPEISSSETMNSSFSDAVIPIACKMTAPLGAECPNLCINAPPLEMCWPKSPRDNLNYVNRAIERVTLCASV